MSHRVAALLDTALALSEAERAELAELITASLSAPASSIHPAWDDEIRRRAAQVDSGHVQSVSWEEVRKQVQAQLNAGVVH